MDVFKRGTGVWEMEPWFGDMGPWFWGVRVEFEMIAFSSLVHVYINLLNCDYI